MLWLWFIGWSFERKTVLTWTVECSFEGFVFWYWTIFGIEM